jgi:PAS domain S-box-containing protein
MADIDVNDPSVASNPSFPVDAAKAATTMTPDYRLLVEHSVDVIWTADLEMRWTFLSPSMEAVYGFLPNEVLGQCFLEYISPASRKLVTTTYQEVWIAAQKDPSVLHKPYSFEIEMLHKGGYYFWVEVRATFLLDSSGIPNGIIGTTRDISDRKQAEAALQISEKRYRMLTETTSDWVWEIDESGVYSYASPKIKSWLDYDPEEVVGRSPFDFMPPDEAERVAVSFEKIAANRAPFVAFENIMVHKNGSQVLVETSGVPLYDAKGNFMGYQGCDCDVTNRKRVEKELKDYASALEITNKSLETYYAAAQAATKAKSEFLANMSHEIRTPMTAILGFTDILLENLRSTFEIEAAQTIKRNGDYLLKLINDILDLSKIEAGRLVVERTTCSPVTIAADIVTMMNVRATAKRLQIELQWIGTMPETIHSDPLRFRQVLINLIDNAIKFTVAGVVRVIGKMVVGTDQRPMLQFDVVDSGIGMTPEQVARLFQPFAQADSSTSRRFGGTGLGLVISKRLAEMLGGDITVSSIPRKGSVFSFTLDVGTPSPTLSGKPEAAPDVAVSDEMECVYDPAKKLTCRLLLAEDGPDNQRLLSHILRKAGVEIMLAENGQAAVELVLEARRQGTDFDLILMDMQMPILDGYDATRRLRSTGFETPIVALTAHAMTSDRDKCLAAGCNNYLTKPIDRALLLNMVARYARKESRKQEAAGTPVGSEKC